MSYQRPHYPRVRVITPEPTDAHPWVENVLTRIEVDGALWPIVAYKIESEKVEGTQRITLTFEGRVTVEFGK